MNLQIENENMLFPIGVVAKMFKISVATLRLYETEGLLLPQKSEGKHRQYSTGDIRRLECIRRLLDEQGLNLAGIRMMFSAIPCWEIKPCSENDRKKCDAFLKANNPCWVVEHKPDKCKESDCSLCPVYTESSGCDNMKTLLKKFWRTNPDVKNLEKA
jgi:MerR family transcriptional regulator/heat shock protein HspR